MRRLFIYILGVVSVVSSVSVDAQDNGGKGRFLPSEHPDRIILTWSSSPSLSQSVTWRTDSTAKTAIAQLAIATHKPGFDNEIIEVKGTTETTITQNGIANHHSVEFQNLNADSKYLYRVAGGNGVWSEWNEFKTAEMEESPFTFIYLGDAQNDILSKWSRVVRSAVLNTPDTRFIVHAGDLVDLRGGNNYDDEWGEWFEAASWINRTIPSVVAIGNHEYPRPDPSRPANTDNLPYLTPAWAAHFTLPLNGPAGLEETVYYLDYQDVRFVVLNPVDTDRLDIQEEWMENVLSAHSNKWTIVVMHYPVYSVGKGRDNAELRQRWLPIFEKHKVDLVLQGHDHTYGRHGSKEQPQRIGREPDTDLPVYIVSVAGPKMYSIDDGARWMNQVADSTQLYQVVSVDSNRLKFESRTALHEVLDSFEIFVEANGRKILRDTRPLR